jgi:GH3 auxin-responsive promoter
VIGAAAAALLRALTAARAARFERALGDCAAVQRQTLARLVRTAAETDYGRHFGLHRDDGLDGFHAKLPLVSYSELQPWIERSRSGEPDVLVSGRVRHFEPTSGSGGGAKLIPYNDALLASFRSLFAIWANDLLQHMLRPRSGRVFISVSPRVSAQSKARHDADYLSGLLRVLLARFLVTSDFRQTDIDAARFRDELALALIRCSDLEVISVWSPTYLLVLLAHVEARRTELAARLPRARRRLIETNHIDWAHVWPQLQLVSCWTAAAANAPSQQLARCLPHARLQGKGLLATEAPITVPLVQAAGCVPLIDEVFIELEDTTGLFCLLQEAQPDRDYAVIVTTTGGLMRYRLGDRVRVIGHWRDTPLLDFVGRVDAVCDLVGEKLDESQVGAALRTLLPTTAYALLVPETGAMPAYYRLITDACIDNLAFTLDAALCAGHRYREARALGQLASPQVLTLPDARRVVHDLLIADGMAAGDIKDTALLYSLDRAARLLSELSAAGVRR